jgi:hypothetical protein
LDEYLDCNFTLDRELESSGIYFNASNVIKYAIVGDGSHDWSVECADNASNFNYSSIVNFTVEAPPSVELISPSEGYITNFTNLNLTYVPIDPIGITQCELIFDGAFNDSSSSVSPNQNNTFTVIGLSEGVHNWTVNCSDSDNNWNWSLEKNFTVDLTPPNIILEYPSNESGIYYDISDDRIRFYWKAIDLLDDDLNCNITVDNVQKGTDIPVTSNISAWLNVDGLSLGVHYWNVSCIDSV